MIMDIAILGVGSSFGSDDIAQQVVIKLKKKLQISKINISVHIGYHDRPGLHLLEIMKGYPIVHLVDAVLSDKPIGYIHRYEDFDKFETQNKMLSSHGLGLAETIALGKTLEYLPNNIIIHGIEISVINNADETEILNRAIETLVDSILKEVALYLKK
jgi:hydrogenase maturation protease